MVKYYTVSRRLNQRIMELESEVEEARAVATAVSPSPSVASTLPVSGGGPWGDTARRDLEKRITLKCS